MKYTKYFSAPVQNFAGLQPPYSELEMARVTILPVPYDSTTEWHSGTRHGPHAIIEASKYLELYDLESGKEIHTIGIHTLPDIEPVLNSPKEMVERVYLVASELIKQNKFVVMLGGEHTLSIGVIMAYKEKYPNISILQLDAHADLRDKYLGTKFSHACTMRRIIEQCPVAQVGIRSLSLEEQRFMDLNNMKPFFDIVPLTDSTMKNIVDSLTENIYITIDLDILDPSIMSAVGTPEPGGILWQDILNILKPITYHKHVVGFDLMEHCPDKGPPSCSFLAAKLAYKLLGYSLVKN